jgi:hypothetical protein
LEQDSKEKRGERAMTYNKPSVAMLASAFGAIQSCLCSKDADNGDLLYTPTAAYEVDE